MVAGWSYHENAWAMMSFEFTCCPAFISAFITLAAIDLSGINRGTYCAYK
jgi:hypothetical protein